MLSGNEKGVSGRDDAIKAAGYATPGEHGQKLLEPSASRMLRDIEVNRVLLGGCSTEVLGSDLATLRKRGREELWGIVKSYNKKIGDWEGGQGAADLRAPLIVTGHQCQFFHCGILIKYVLANYLASMCGGFVWNLAVDSDLAKYTELKVPLKRDGRLSVERLAFAGLPNDLPMEQIAPPSAEQLDQMIGQLESLAEFAAWEKGPQNVKKLASVLKQLHGQTKNLAEFFTLLNRRLAGQLGWQWLELPVSAMTFSESFYGFVLDLLTRRRQMLRCYNDALDQFRAANNVRNASRPLPNLREADSAVEMPLWLLGPGHGRSSLYVHEALGAVLLGDANEGIIELPSRLFETGADGAQEFGKLLAQRGYSLRPKALTLTSYARLFFADYFVHGIGGARYDQVTDVFIKSFYGLIAPGFACASATMRLVDYEGPDLAAVEAGHLRLNHFKRDIYWNPQRHVNVFKGDGVLLLVAERARAADKSDRLAEQQADSYQRREVFNQIRELNEKLRAYTDGPREMAKAAEKKGTELHNDAAIAANREFFFGLFDRAELVEQLSVG